MAQLKEVAEQKDFLLKCVKEIDKYLYDNKEEIVPDPPFCESIFVTSKSDYQIYNLKVIVFQIKKLMEGIEKGRFYNFPISEKKIELIINNFVKDIKRFIQKEKITHLERSLNICCKLSQTQFDSKDIFEMILIRCADKTKIGSTHNVELYLNNLIRQASIRLAVELKVKEIIGFKSYLDNKGQKKFISIITIINFLKNSKKKWLDIPIELDEIKSIYLWACDFIHNGKIIYEWQIHHALYSLCDLFDITKANEFNTEQYCEDLYFRKGGKEPFSFCEEYIKMINSDEIATPNNISYFKVDKDIWDLEDAMNADKKIGLKNGVIKLDVKEFGWDQSIFDSSVNSYIKSYK